MVAPPLQLASLMVDGGQAAMTKKRIRDGGAVLVEAALVMPLLILLLVGIVEFGRVWNAQLSLTHAAREGIRHYVVSGDDAGAIDVVNAATTVATSDISFSANCDPEGDNVGTPITLTVEAAVKISIPFWDGSGPFELQGIGTMRCGG